MKERYWVKHLLDAIWNENMDEAMVALREGASPSHRVNGYPLLLHAVYTRNVDMIRLLIRYGAMQTSEAMGYALELGYGEVVLCLWEMGVMPRSVERMNMFGPTPCRQTALSLWNQSA